MNKIAEDQPEQKTIKYKAPAYSIERADTYSFRVVKTTFEGDEVKQELLCQDVHPVAMSVFMGEVARV